MTNKCPLISCVCVTHNRPNMLERVIKCFEYQTYNNKQLVIVYEELDKLTKAYIDSHTFSNNIKIIMISLSIPKLTLGELRNISIQKSDGEYICQWDDDDWYSCERLEIQLKYLLKMKKTASILLRWIIYDDFLKKSYLSFIHAWEGSILCKKEILTLYPYPPIEKGEDVSVIKQLISKHHIALIENEPEIYVYVFHRNNTWENSHFDNMISSSIELPKEINEEVIECLKC